MQSRILALLTAIFADSAIRLICPPTVMISYRQIFEEVILDRLLIQVPRKEIAKELKLTNDSLNTYINPEERYQLKRSICLFEKTTTASIQQKCDRAFT